MVGLVGGGRRQHGRLVTACAARQIFAPPHRPEPRSYVVVPGRATTTARAHCPVIATLHICADLHPSRSPAPAQSIAKEKGGKKKERGNGKICPSTCSPRSIANQVRGTQSALFNFRSLLLVLLLLICTSAYVHHFTPGIMDRNKNGYDAI